MEFTTVQKGGNAGAKEWFVSKDTPEIKQLKQERDQALTYRNTYETLLKERDEAREERDRLRVQVIKDLNDLANRSHEISGLAQRVGSEGESGRRALAAMTEIKQKIKDMPDLALYAPAHSLADWILQIIEKHEAD